MKDTKKVAKRNSFKSEHDIIGVDIADCLTVTRTSYPDRTSCDIDLDGDYVT